MDILVSLIFIPFLVGIITNRVDAILFAPIVEDVLKRLQEDDKQVSHELKKALKVCLLSALQSIVLECHKELLGFSPVKRYRGVIVYLPEHREELQWLDSKLRQLAKELKQVKTAKYLDIPLLSLDEIASLLTPEGQLAEKYMLSLKEKLIAEALLKDSFVPEVYEAKIRKYLFKKLQETFVDEVHLNPKIRELFQVKLISQINTRLIAQDTKIKQLEQVLYQIKNSQIEQPHEARRRVRLEFDIEKLDAYILEEIVEDIRRKTGDESITIRRIKEGSMDIIFDGSQKGLEKLEALIKSGEVKELSGINVKFIDNDDSELSVSETVVNIREWFQNIFNADWENLEDILGKKRSALVLASRNAPISQGIVRAKRIYLEMESNSQPINLVLDVISEANQKIGIHLQVHPTENQPYLPKGLIFSVLDDSDEIILESQARDTDNWIQLDIGVELGDEFRIKIVLGDAIFKQNFAI